MGSCLLGSTSSARPRHTARCCHSRRWSRLWERAGLQTTLLLGDHEGRITEPPGGGRGCHLGPRPPSAWHGRRAAGTASPAGPGQALGRPPGPQRLAPLPVSPSRLPTAGHDSGSVGGGGPRGHSRWPFALGGRGRPAGPSWGSGLGTPPQWTPAGWSSDCPAMSTAGTGVGPTDVSPEKAWDTAEAPCKSLGRPVNDLPPLGV